MTLPAFSLCAIVGLIPLLFLASLPSLLVTVAGAVLALLLLFLRGPVRVVGVILLCVCWGVGIAQYRLQQIAALVTQPQSLQVVINATDGATRHDVKVLKVNNRWLPGGPGIMLYGRNLPVPVCGGQRWDMVIALRPVHGKLNEGLFDSQRYSVSQGRLLTGRIISAAPVDVRCGLRDRYITSVKTALQQYHWRDVIMALGFGERLNVSDAIKTLMQDTGTAHLMAISGLHIALAGSLGWVVARLLQWGFPVRLIGYRFPLLISLVAATIYTWLAGSNPPAIRTWVALSIWTAIRLSGRQWHPWQVWLCCIAGMLLFDPFSILSESLWLSAFAVGSLIFWYQWMPARKVGGPLVLKALYRMLHLQFGITLLLLPLQLHLFHGISVTSLVANLFAIPLITFVSVPLILGGMVVHLTPFEALEQSVWWLADRSLAMVFYALNLLPAGWVHVDGRFRWLMLLPWCAVIAWRLRLMATIPCTLLSIGLICAWPFYRAAHASQWAIHMLDVGHGLAMVIERQGHAVLYDTGNAWQGGDSAKQTIIPWLRWHHLRPEGIILSHEHLDHRGGLNSLLETWPDLTVRSSLGWIDHLPCERGQQWRWQGLTFTVHWPLPGHTRQGNNRSCVVNISDGHHSILLTGDIEASAELAMLKQYWQHLRADIIQVPHHGSKTSSTPLLLRRVEGKVALASVARYNAWRLPASRVVERYRQQGYTWHDTAHAGQISIIFNTNGWQLLRYREHVFPRWYHQWFGVLADSR